MDPAIKVLGTLLIVETLGFYVTRNFFLGLFVALTLVAFLTLVITTSLAAIFTEPEEVP